MPVLMAVIARHYRALDNVARLLGRAIAVVTERKITFAITELVIVWLIIRVTRSIAASVVSAYRK